MTLLAWLAIGLGVWLLDSAVRGRSPIETIKNVITGDTDRPANLPPIGTPAGIMHETASKTGSSDSTVDGWIAKAMTIMSKHGVNMARVHANNLKTIIEHESGGNPNAINRWDSNARAGHPSQGLMQTIPSTFHAYALPGYDNILSPVDNIIAGTRYAISRYGYTWQVPGIVALHNGNPYVGY